MFRINIVIQRYVIMIQTMWLLANYLKSFEGCQTDLGTALLNAFLFHMNFTVVNAAVHHLHNLVRNHTN